MKKIPWLWIVLGGAAAYWLYKTQAPYIVNKIAYQIPTGDPNQHLQVVLPFEHWTEAK